MVSVRKQARQKQGLKEASSAMFESVGFFLQLNPHFKSLEKDSAEAKVQAVKLLNLVRDFYTPEPAPAPDAIAVAKEGLAASVTSVQKRAPGLTILGALIPLLLNREAREYLASFLKGLIGVESLGKIKTAINLVTSVLVGIFTVKLFKQVSDTINAFIKLSQLTGALFNMSNDATDDIVGQSDDLDREKQKIEEKKKRDRAKRKKRLINRQKKVKRVKAIKNAFGKLTKVARLAGPIAIAGIVANIAVGSLIDYLSRDEEESISKESKAEEEDEEADVPEESEEIKESEIGKIWEIVKSNAIETLTFGLLSKETIENTKKVFAGDKETIQANRAAVSGLSVGAGEFGGLQSHVDVGEEAPSAKQVAPEPVAAPVNTATTTGQNISADSEKIIAEKKDQQATNLIITNIDNSAYVHIPEEKRSRGGVYSYSTSVGA